MRKIVEAIVAILLPPACREEVLGDLAERYRSLLHYLAEAFSTVPMVIMSRIRRTADPPIVLMQALALYVSFLFAAWFIAGPFLQEPWGLLRLAIPCAIAMFALLLEDAWSRPGPRSALRPARGPVLGLLLAFAFNFALPRWIMFFGSAMSLVLLTAIRIVFPSVVDQLAGANAPAAWLKRTIEPRANPRQSPAFIVVVLLLLLLAAWEVSKG